MSNQRNQSQASASRRQFLKSTALATGGILAGAGQTFSIGTSTSSPILQTKYGKVEGLITDGISCFKGIPYGAPTGMHRFQPAPEPEKWSGIRPAINYGYSAPQGKGDESSEDCLFLNIWTPALNDGKKRPILLYLHGGAFSNGTGSRPILDGTNLSRQGDVVVITINHRLNAFGYLYLGMLNPEHYASSGNVGQLDIIQALNWVREHAALLGGDAQNISLFGQSGGGAKIATLMAMPQAKGLFHRAWTMSGQQVVAAGPRAATQRAELLLKELGINPNNMALLRSVPMKTLLQASKIKDPSRVENRSLHFCPVLDHVVLPCHPFYPGAAAQSANIPLVIGNTKDETRAFLGHIPGIHELEWERLPQLLLENQFVDIRPEVVIETYRKLYPNYTATEIFFAATTAGRSWRGAVIEAEERARQVGTPTWVYQLNWQSPKNGGKLGACHAMDIPLVFNNTAVPGSATENGSSAQAMAQVMSETLLAFARTGNPNNPQLPNWKPYTLPERSTMLFDEQSQLENDPRGEERKLYGQVPFLQRGTY